MVSLEAEISERPLNFLDEIQSAAGSFEQIIREQDGYVVDRQTGTFIMQRPRKLRWQISELDQLLVSDGQQLFLYDELFQQVVVRDWSSNPAENPAAILLDQIGIEEWATVEKVGQSYRLTPLKGFGSILELNLSMMDSFPEMLSILDATGQTTEIRFSQVKLNAEYKDELFRFVMPAGVEVLYE
jgi:outer membrane lipoprotein carrier protein